MGLDTILVAVGDDDEDRTDAIADTAVDIAGPAGATVALAHVFSESQYDRLVKRLDFDPSADVNPDTVANRHATLRRLGDRFDEAGIDSTRHGAVGDKGERIVELAGSLDADLVIVSGRKRSPTGKAVFGSTAQEIMLNAPCPVTFVRAD